MSEQPLSAERLAEMKTAVSAMAPHVGAVCVKRAELVALLDMAERVAALDADTELAAGELMVPIPEPGTDMSRLLIANRILKGERSTLLEMLRDMTGERDALKKEGETYRSYTERLVRERDMARKAAADAGNPVPLLQLQN